MRDYDDNDDEEEEEEEEEEDQGEEENANTILHATDDFLSNNVDHTLTDPESGNENPSSRTMKKQRPRKCIKWQSSEKEKGMKSRNSTVRFSSIWRWGWNWQPQHLG